MQAPSTSKIKNTKIAVDGHSALFVFLKIYKQFKLCNKKLLSRKDKVPVIRELRDMPANLAGKWTMLANAMRFQGKRFFPKDRIKNDARGFYRAAKKLGRRPIMRKVANGLIIQLDMKEDKSVT